MTEHRTITLRVPRRDDSRPWVAVQIEVRDRDGWRSVQAVPVREARRRLAVPVIIPADATAYRAVWVADGGSGAGLHVTDPVDLEG